MHLGRERASERAGCRVGRPQVGVGKPLGEIFEDRQRLPDLNAAVGERRHLAGARNLAHPLLEVVGIERDHLFFERDSCDLHRDPGPERPRRVVLVADDELERHPCTFMMLSRVVRRLDRSAGSLPGTEAPGDMGNRFQAHALRGLRRQRGALPGCAEEHEALVRSEDRLVILALRIDPEFQHTARTVEGTGHPAFAMELANVAQVDEDDVVAAVERERVLRGQGFDRRVRRPRPAPGRAW